MKMILTTLCLLVGLSAFGQGTTIRAINGLGTNTTIYDGLTLRPGAAAANRGITNIGPMLIYLGAGSLGSVLNILDTNLTGRLQIQGHNIYLNDTNGASQLRVTSLGVELPTGPISGDGSGLTNVPGIWTNSGPGIVRLIGALTSIGIKTNTGGIIIGPNAEAGWAFDNRDGLIILHDPTAGDQNETRFAVTSVEDVNVYNNYGEFLIIVQTNNVGLGIETFSPARDGFHFDVTTGVATMVIRIAGIPQTTIQPGVGDGFTPYALGSSVTRTTGYLLELANNGTNKFTVGYDGAVVSDGHPGFVGDGGGLTNLASATNFSSTSVYNFNGKVTFNAVSYNTNLWAGPTNTLLLSTNYQDYITTTDVNITNVGGQLARQNTWATLTISNASAGDITVRSTAAGLRPQGSGTSAAMVVGAGKEGILSFLSRDFKSTNYVTTAQQ